jgi:hypothetical protein
MSTLALCMQEMLAPEAEVGRGFSAMHHLPVPWQLYCWRTLRHGGAADSPAV